MDILKSLFWNKAEERFRALFRIIFVLLMVAVMVNPVVLIIDALFENLLTPPLINFLVAVGFFIAVMTAQKYLDKGRPSDFGLYSVAESSMPIFFSFLFGAVLVSIITLILFLGGFISIETTFYVTEGSSKGFIILLLGQVLRYLFGSFFEELMTRGYLLKNLAEGINDKKFFNDKRSIFIAALLTSVIFGVTHLFNENSSLIAALNLSLLGYLFALSYVYTGALGWPIGLHMGWNLFQNNVFGFHNSGKDSLVSFISFGINGNECWTGGEFGLEASLGTTIVLATTIIIATFNMKGKAYKIPIFPAKKER